MQDAALKIQMRYNLAPEQLAGLLQINDFFQRIALFDCPVTDLRVVEYRNGTEISCECLPAKTVQFFGTEKCSNFKKFFNPHSAPDHFERFAQNILSRIRLLSDYVGVGSLEICKTHAVETTYTHTHGGRR